MTKRKSLELCVEMWSGLAKNGAKQKPTTNLENDCACCEYVCQLFPSERDGMSCGMSCGGHGENGVDTEVIKFCPLKSLWPDGCCHAGSPFLEWVHAINKSPSIRRRFARVITDGARKALRELRKP
jgi:hypothetical protein